MIIRFHKSCIKSYARFHIIAMIALVLCILIQGGCARKIYLPVETLKISRDTLKITRTDHDTVVIKDSVYVAVLNDTVVKETYRWRIRDRMVHDTVMNARTDTVYIERIKPPVGGRSSSASSMKSILFMLLISVALLFSYRLFRQHR